MQTQELGTYDIRVMYLFLKGNERDVTYDRNPTELLFGPEGDVIGFNMKHHDNVGK